MVTFSRRFKGPKNWTFLKRCLFYTSVYSSFNLLSSLSSSGLSIAQSESIELIQWRAVQTISSQRIKMDSPDYDVTLQILNLARLDKRRKELAFSFAMSLYNSPVFRNWLPPFNSGNSRLRKHNLLVPVKARTVKYKKSPIPYFTDLINERKICYSYFRRRWALQYFFVLYCRSLLINKSKVFCDSWLTYSLIYSIIIYCMV